MLVAALLLVSPALVTPSVAATNGESLPVDGGTTITLASDTGRSRLVFASRPASPAPSPRCGTTSRRSLRRGRSRATCGPRPAVLLASVNFTGETASGWQTANLAQPVALAKDKAYTVSYFAPKGGYAATLDYFRGAPVVSGSAHRTRRRATACTATARRPAFRTPPTRGHRTTGPTSSSPRSSGPVTSRPRPRRRPATTDDQAAGDDVDHHNLDDDH